MTSMTSNILWKSSGSNLDVSPELGTKEENCGYLRATRQIHLIIVALIFSSCLAIKKESKIQNVISGSFDWHLSPSISLNRVFCADTLILKSERFFPGDVSNTDLLFNFHINKIGRDNFHICFFYRKNPGSEMDYCVNDVSGKWKIKKTKGNAQLILKRVRTTNDSALKVFLKKEFSFIDCATGQEKRRIRKMVYSIINVSEKDIILFRNE